MDDSTLGMGVPPSPATRFDVVPPPAQHLDPSVPLTKAGVPKKKPGRKPGSTVKPRDPDSDAAKTRKPRKPRDPNSPPIQRKRKAPPTTVDGTTPNNAAPAAPLANHNQNSLAAAAAAGASLASFAGPSRPQQQQARISDFTNMRMAASRSPSQSGMVTKTPKRESMPSSMQNILNADPEPSPPATAPSAPAPARSVFDPVRGSYDPVRETMLARDPYGTASLGSPRAATTMVNRASASPSIASLVDGPVPQMRSPTGISSFNVTQLSHPAAGSRQEQTSMPPSPSHPIRTAPHAISAAPSCTAAAAAARAPAPAAAPQAAQSNGMTSASTSSVSAAPRVKTATAAPARVSTKLTIKPVVRPLSELKKQPPAPPSVPSLKPEPPARQTGTGSILGLLKRPSPKQTSVASSPPNHRTTKEAHPSLPGGSSNPLDFGKIQVGETDATSIVLRIPLNGETNKYVNFMQLAEERFGWDVLHPRAAAQRDRKARIAAATSALAQAGSGRESGDEMSEDVSEAENSAIGGLTSGAEAKPIKKKRNFKEDEYDKDDDFVDDSEMLWEEQAAASKDGFFVYSGPLIREAPDPVAEPAPKRGRGSRGGRAGGRGAAAVRGGGPGSRGGGAGRGGGPGSRGGQVRKPRATKAEKEQRERDARDRLAALAGGTGLLGSANPFAAGMTAS